MFRFNYPSPNSDHAPFVYRLGLPILWLRYADHVSGCRCLVFSETVRVGVDAVSRLDCSQRYG